MVRESRLADIYKSELKNKGLLGALVSAIGERTKEKTDIRRILPQSGLTGAAFGKMFGKAYKYNDRPKSSVGSVKNVGSTVGSSGDSAVSQEVNEKLTRISTDNRITAKNTIVLPAMARDMNLTRMNIQKLVNLSGGKASTKSDMFFKRAGEREDQYESQYKKNTITKTPAAATATPAVGGGGLGGILGKLIGPTILTALTEIMKDFTGVLKSFFSPANILKHLVTGFPLALLVASIGKGIKDAFDEYEKSGNLSEASLKFLSGMTFGLLNEEFFQIHIITPIVDFVESTESMLRKMFGKVTPKTVTKTEEQAGGTTTTIPGGAAVAVQRTSQRPTDPNSLMGRMAARKAAEAAAKTSSTSPTPVEKNPLLDMIAKGESEGAGGYNAMNQGTISGKVMGSGSSEKIIKEKLTDMTVGQVMERGAKKTDDVKTRKEKGLIFAAGRYQIIPETLAGLVKQGIVSKDDKFDETTQDKLGMALIEQTGAMKLASAGKFDEAQNALAKIFASIPLATDVDDKKAGQSYYEKKGENTSHSGLNVKGALMSSISPTGLALASTPATPVTLPKVSGTSLETASLDNATSRMTSSAAAPTIVNAPVTNNMSSGGGGGNMAAASVYDNELAKKFFSSSVFA
jgi:hypothetical protein